MSPAVLEATARLATRPHGMLLVTGPTGSGKTTTLYAALQRRDASREKIITVEDPIEYQLPGIVQMPVHAQAGVTFASALRAILRQDPDVVMIGEMRDRETAEMAMQAAMTGHLVFSTLHTNDAIAAIPRLLDLGIPDYLASATLEGVLAQRLVRRVCPACRVEYAPNAEAVALVGGVDGRDVTAHRGQTFTRGAGCVECRGTGFRGRVGIYELVTMTHALREAIASGAARSVMHAHAVRAGMQSMLSDGWAKACAGVTTVEEVRRVVQE
jgi:type II secretory ATPase GspE/PulE/Tfp pilus assembly ATPase PilB-like protein